MKTFACLNVCVTNVGTDESTKSKFNFVCDSVEHFLIFRQKRANLDQQVIKQFGIETQQVWVLLFKKGNIGSDLDFSEFTWESKALWDKKCFFLFLYCTETLTQRHSGLALIASNDNRRIHRKQRAAFKEEKKMRKAVGEDGKRMTKQTINVLKTIITTSNVSGKMSFFNICRPTHTQISWTRAQCRPNAIKTIAFFLKKCFERNIEKEEGEGQTRTCHASTSWPNKLVWA